MGSCYSDDHIAGDHIYTNLTTCNIEEPLQKYCLGTIRNRLLGGLSIFYWISVSTGISGRQRPNVSRQNVPLLAADKSSLVGMQPQGLVAIFLLFIIFHIMYDYTIKGANDEKIKI